MDYTTHYLTQENMYDLQSFMHLKLQLMVKNIPKDSLLYKMFDENDTDEPPFIRCSDFMEAFTIIFKERKADETSLKEQMEKLVRQELKEVDEACEKAYNESRKIENDLHFTSYNNKNKFEYNQTSESKAL